MGADQSAERVEDGPTADELLEHSVSPPFYRARLLVVKVEDLCCGCGVVGDIDIGLRRRSVVSHGMELWWVVSRRGLLWVVGHGRNLLLLVVHHWILLLRLRAVCHGSRLLLLRVVSHSSRLRHRITLLCIGWGCHQTSMLLGKVWGCERKESITAGAEEG